MDITLKQVGDKYEIRNENRLIAVLLTREAADHAMSLLNSLKHDVEENSVESVHRESHINLFDSHRFHFDEPRTR